MNIRKNHSSTTYEADPKEVIKELNHLYKEAVNLKVSFVSALKAEAPIATEMACVVNHQIINELDLKCRKLSCETKRNKQNILTAKKKKIFGGIDYDTDKYIDEERHNALVVTIPSKYNVVGFKKFLGAKYDKYIVNNQLGGSSTMPGVVDFSAKFKDGDTGKIFDRSKYWYITTGNMLTIIEAMQDLDAVMTALKEVIKGVPSCGVRKMFITEDNIKYYNSLKDRFKDYQDKLNNL